MFDSIFGSSKDPMKAANPYFQKAEDAMRQYMQPYVDMGAGVAPGLLGEYGKMMNDPAAMLEMFMSGYEPSKQYQMQEDRMGQAASNSAAAGGFRGAPLEQANQQEITQGLLSQDMDKWLQNVMGIHSGGLAGNQGIFNTGYNASTGLSSDLSNLYGTQASMAYGSEKDKQAQQQGLYGSLLGAGTGLATAYMNPYAKLMESLMKTGA